MQLNDVVTSVTQMAIGDGNKTRKKDWLYTLFTPKGRQNKIVFMQIDSTFFFLCCWMDIFLPTSIVHSVCRVYRCELFIFYSIHPFCPLSACYLKNSSWIIWYMFLSHQLNQKEKINIGIISSWNVYIIYPNTLFIIIRTTFEFECFHQILIRLEIFAK